jgi:very-short-patch-repair endonuclease
MNLCACGCGKEVVSEKNIYILGHNSRTNEYKEKYKNTCLRIYGTESSNQSENIKIKKIQKSQEHFGTNNPMQSKEVQKKSKQTTIDRFGGIGMASSVLCKKIQDTNQKRYGGISPYCSKEVQKKSKQTTIDRFGGIGFSVTLLAKKSNDTIQKIYNVDNYSKTLEFRTFAREQLINDITNEFKDGEEFSPRKGHQETQILNEFEIKTNFILPIRGKEIIGYFPDARNEEYKVIVEVYEPWHRRVCYVKHDNQRQKDLETIGYKVFIIWQDDWFKNKEKVISYFKEVFK